MNEPHYFWMILTGACILWYSTITIYVSIKGAKDIKVMLRDLDKKHHENLKKTYPT